MLIQDILRPVRAVVQAVVTLCLLGGSFYFASRLSVAFARRAWLVVFTAIVGAAVSMMVTHSFVERWGLRTDSPRDGLWAMMDGSATRPFVFRRLAPDLTRIATDFTIDHLPAAKVDAFLEKSTLAREYGGPGRTRRTDIALHWAFLLVSTAWFGVIVAGAALLRACRGCSWLEGVVSAILAVSLVPLTFGNGGYIYDGLELFLWLCVLLSIKMGRSFLAPVFFALMLFNKESALACVPALYPLLSHRTSRRTAAVWVAALGALGAFWLFFVRSAYAGNSGQAQEWFLFDNLVFWRNPLNFLRFAAMYAPALPAPRGANLAILLLVFLPVRYGWRSISEDVRQAAFVTAAVFIPLFFVSGCMDETRALNPLFPFLFIIGSEGIARLFSVARPENAAPG